MRQENNGDGPAYTDEETERQRLLNTNNANQSNQQQANYNTSSQPIHQQIVSFLSLYYINILVSLCSHDLIFLCISYALI